jgi:lipase
MKGPYPTRWFRSVVPWEKCFDPGRIGIRTPHGHTTMKEIDPVERRADIGDVLIDYLDYPSNGPPLLLLHATGFLPRLWHPVARRLAVDYHVIAPYFCDYRHTDPEKGGFSWKQIAEDLMALCRLLEIERPYVTGHSMGGAVALIAAGALGMDPVKMVLIEPIILPEAFYHVKMGVHEHPLASKSIKRRNQWADQAEARQYLESKSFFGWWNAEVLELYLQHGIKRTDTGQFSLRCHPSKEASLFMGSMDFNPWPVFERIHCPVLVVEGEHTEYKGFIDSQKVADVLPQGSYTVAARAGHLLPMEKPERTLSIVREFWPP